MSATSEIQAATLQQFIEAWKKWTPEDLLPMFSADFRQIALPFNSEKHTRSRQDVERWLPILMSTLSSFELTIHNVVHDLAERKAAIYAMTKADTPFGPYNNEQAVFVWLNETGDKVERLEEMFDSAFMAKFMPNLLEYTAKQSAAQTV